MMIRRFVAAGLAFLLVALSPGFECYHAVAATVATQGRPARGAAAAPAASSSIPSVGGLTLPLSRAEGAAGDVSAAASGASAAALPSAAGASAIPGAQPAVRREAAGENALDVEIAPEAARVAKRPAVKRLLNEAVARFAKPAALAVGIALGASSLPSATLAQSPNVTLTQAQASQIKKTDADVDESAQPRGAVPAPAPAVKAPLKAEAAVEGKTVEIGGEVVVTIKLSNTGKEPVSIAALADALKNAAPGSIVVRGVVLPEGAAIKPGETVSVPVRVQLLQVNEVPAGGVGPVKVEAFKVETPAFAFVFPEIKISGRAVLPSNWKDGQFNQAKKPLLQRVFDTSWWVGLLLLPLGWLLARRASGRGKGSEEKLERPKAAAAKFAAALDAAAKHDDAKAFYGALSGALSDYLSETLGLSRDEGRTNARLLADVRAAGGLADTQLASLEALLGRADAVVYGGQASDASQRAADLEAARAMGSAKPEAAKSASLFSMAAPALVLPFGLGDGATIELGDPHMLWAFLIFIPLAIKLALDARATKKNAIPVSTLQVVPRGRTFGQYLRWIPNTLIALGMAAAILAATAPREGSLLTKMVVPVTKIISMSDNSGSMGSPMDGGDGITKLEAVVAAEKAFIRDQRKGASNQVGVAMWDTSVIVISPLTTDLRAAEAALAQVRLGGGTDMDIAIRTGVNIFLKRNIVEIDEEKHPEARELKKAMWEKGLGAALAIFLKEKPGSPLWKLVVRPDQAKVMRVLTDGDSSGDPIRAAQIAKAYGVKIHTIGIPASDLKPELLTKIAEITGGRYAVATDPAALEAIQLAISQETKTPVAVTIPTHKSHQDSLNLIAFLMLSAGVALRYLKIKTLALAAAVAGALAFFMPAGAFAQTTRPAPIVTPRYDVLNPQVTIPELQRGRRLVEQARALEAQGKKTEADVLYREAVMTIVPIVGRYPDLAEPRFAIGTAFLGMGEIERAEQFLRQALAMAVKSGDKRMQGQVLYQLATSALIDEDTEGADILLKQALQASPDDVELKENAERLQRMMEEQEKEQKESKDKKDQKGKQQAKQQKSGQQKQRADQRRDGQKQQGKQQGEKEKGQEPTPGDGDEKGKPDQDEISKQLGEAQKGQEKSAPPPGGFGKMWGIIGAAGLGASLMGLAPGTSPSAMAAGAEAASQAGALAWSNPALLLAVAVVAPILALMAGYQVWSSRRAARAAAPRLAEDGVRSMARREFLGAAALIGGTALVGAAAAAPWSGMKEIVVNFGGGRDIVVLIDVSNSVVHAEDGRFTRAMMAVDGLIRGMRSSNKLDRLALVPFAEQAGSGALTTDYEAMLERLADMRQENFRFKGGSQLSAAILRSIELYENADETDPLGKRERVVILLSDGGDVLPRDYSEAEAEKDQDKAEARALNEALKAARAKGVRVYTVGIGSSSGAKMLIPAEVRAKDESLPTYIKDASGQDVVVKLNLAALEAVARGTGGEPLVAESGKGLAETLKKISVIERQRGGGAVETVKVKDPLASFLSLPGTLLLAAGLWLQRRPPLEERGGAKLHSYTLAPLAMFGLHDWKDLLPDVYGAGFGFSVLIALGLGALLYDVAAQGFFGARPLRRLGFKFDEWGGLLSRNMRKDGAALLLGPKGRAVDAAHLEAFLKSWASAGRTLRSSTAKTRKLALLASVGAKDELWREKLAAAYVSERSPEMRAEIRAAMSAVDGKHLAPLSETLDRLVSQRSARRWLRSDLASTRLASLFSREDLTRPAVRGFFEELADSADPALRAEVRKMLDRAEAPSRTWGQRLRALPAVLAVAALLGGAGLWNGLAVDKIAKAEAKRAAVTEQVSRDFFGSDAYILTQPYADARINEDVLPVLKSWNSLKPQDKARLDKAIQVLMTSTDAKADPVMLFLFRQRVIFDLDKAQQKKLIRTLADRSSVELIQVLVEEMSKRPTPAAKERLDEAIAALGELKGKNNYFMLVQLMREANPAVAKPAFEALVKALKDPKNEAQALGWIKMSLEKLGADPKIRLKHVELILEAVAGRAELAPKDADEAQRMLLSAMAVPDKNGTPDEIALSIGYKIEALSAAAKAVDRLPGLKKNPALREMLWAALTRSTTQTLIMGQQLSSDGLKAMAGRRGLRTVVLDPDILIRDGKFEVPKNVQFGLTEDWLTRYHLNNLRDAAKMLEDQASGQAGSEQLTWPAERGQLYLEGSVMTLKAALALASKLGVAETAPAQNSLAALIGGMAAKIAGDEINSPFQGQTWRELITGSANTNVPFPSTYALSDLPGLLAKLEKIYADNRFDVPSRNPKELTPQERTKLAEQIAKLRPLVGVDPESVVVEDVTARVIRELNGPFLSQSWKEFVTGRTDGVFPGRYTTAELAELVRRAEKVLADGVMDTSERRKENRMALTERERARLTEGLAKMKAMLEAKRAIDARNAPKPAGGATMQSSPIAGGLLAAVAMQMGGVEPLIAALTMGGLLLAGLFMFLRMGLHRSPKRAPEPAASPATLESRFNQLELPARAIADSLMTGMLRSRATGREGFDQVDVVAREPGQDAGGRVDPIATARTGVTHYRLYEQERDMPVMLFVDMSPSTGLGSQAVSKRRVIEDAAGVIALAASQDRSVGMILYSDRVEKVIEPRSGRDAALDLFAELLDFEPSGGRGDLAGALRGYALGDNPRSLIVPISDFLDGGYGALMSAAAAEGHVIMPVVVEDKFDLEPAGVGVWPLRDVETNEIRSVDTSAPSVRREQAAAVERLRRERESAFQQSQALPLRVTTDGRHLDDMIRQSRDIGDAYAQ